MNTTHKSAIGEAIFVVETVAHLQGREAELLAIAEAARAEHAALVAAVRRAYAVERSVTQGQEAELRVGYLDLLSAAFEKCEQYEAAIAST